jgi:hypothetical protein
MSHFSEIENYMRDIISKNHGIFNRESIMKQSAEWMQKFPVEFNSILNFIENEETNNMMDDSTPSVAFHGGYADDSTPSVAFHGGYADDSTPSVAFHGGYADDSTSSIIFGSRIDDDSTPSVAFHDGYANVSTSSVIFGSRIADNSASSVVNMHDQMSPVSNSAMGSDHIDSSPGGYPDDDFDSFMPLQRTMSSSTPRN